MLTSPLQLRGRSAPSRVLFGPHVTNLGRGRALSERHVAYYAERAAGGCGVIVTETASVHESDHPYERAPLAASCGPGWRAIRSECGPALVLAGLGHAGAQGTPAFTGRALWGASGVSDVVSREVPQVMERTEIDALVAGFAAAAAAAVVAGLDGVEIQAGQHSLLRQFLSGLTNHRPDAYGEDRSLLLREVVGAVRAALGPDHVLGLRLCCDELAPWAGITPDSAPAALTAPLPASPASREFRHRESGVPAARVASSLPASRRLRDTESAVPGERASIAQLVDYLVPVRGSGLTVSATRPDLHTPPGFNLPLARGVLGLGVPVVLQGSVVDPAMAEAALEEGVALVEMTRAQIADPRLVAHVRAGTPERIRPCTLANQHRARDPRNPLVSDEAEPRSGHETLDPPLPLTPGGARGDLLVVGGGPAGLEAARTAALHGHRVRLVERAPRLGGALRFAAAVHGRARFGLLVEWWERELDRLGVDVALGVEADPADLSGDVVLATGSVPSPPAFVAGPDVVVLPAGEFEAAVHAAAGPRRPSDPPGPDATSAVLPAGAHVVVHDPIGDWTGVGVAEQVAAAGVPCVLVTPDAVAGTQLSRTGDLADANARLERAGVVRELFARLRSVGSGTALLTDVDHGAAREVPCTVVIDCAHRLPDDGLWRGHPGLLRGEPEAPDSRSRSSRLALPEVPTRGGRECDSREPAARPAGVQGAGRGSPARDSRDREARLVVAGDCVAPRTVHEAVREGRRAVHGLGSSPAAVPAGRPSADPARPPGS
ncbi:FAD-dependent oxidoreductase [Pseudonocardia kujensis]|uniref:oxidoreductase n=1 Tax=Pseudonocardia kujensis TaxID=1128675 RepID=UPI001E3FCED5|nr:FAD-dependent oxidoreductase [Pseudonocardia kujensis]MCE0761591.1 FAD-dependent oxidoreductase [Pseudonocardia kujensis]